MIRVILFILVVVVSCLFFIPWKPTPALKNPKIHGVSLEAPRNPVRTQDLLPLLEVNTEWVSVIPYAFIDPAEPKVQFHYHQLWWGEGIQGTISTMQMAQEIGLEVMLKPHVWVRGQGWAGDFNLRTEEQWELWEDTYREYIMTYARLADSMNVKLFCIGTEFRQAVKQRPGYWRQLVTQVRSIYTGKITYAANWDNYNNVTFWPALDFIGIDAYFPLCERKTPTVGSILEGWQPLETLLKDFSERHGKPILFTEYGYKSIDYTAAGHWKHDEDTLLINNEAQTHAYDGLYQAIWDEPWFAGGFLWKWHLQDPRWPGKRERNFTPQHKPVIKIIKKRYEKYKNPGENE